MTSKNSFVDILVVDDEEDICEVVSEILSDEGYSTRKAFVYGEAVLAIEKKIPQLVLLDVWLGDGSRDGLRLLQYIKSQNPYLPVIMMSGHGTIETAVSAMQNGAYDFIEKPFEPVRLIVSVSKALQNASLQKENENLKVKAKVTDFVLGVSQNVRAINSFIGRVAPLNGRCLIIGNKFADKEDIARKIHNLSPRSQTQFSIVNCSQSDSRYVEQEIFGSEVVSGENVSVTKGLLEKTVGGTLFIDDIDVISYDLQMKLLHLFITNSFVRIGGKRASSLPLCSRIICGMSADPADIIRTGRFNKELYYHISVNKVNVLPLNKRPIDVPVLVQHYLDKMSETYSAQKVLLTPEIVHILQNYTWDEDVIELRNAVNVIFSRVMAHSARSMTVLKEDLPDNISGIVPPVQNLRSCCPSNVYDLGIKDARECFEREYYKKQLDKYSGNVQQTADAVGMDRSALYRRLKLLRIK